MHDFSQNVEQLLSEHQQLIEQKNTPIESHNGVIRRWQQPVITAAHTPVFWRYDLNPETNPLLLERMGINATFNPGAMYWNNKFILAVRVEGVDRKSFFAIAESENGIDNFTFWPKPIALPQTEEPDTNVYDMRLTHHQDGYIYGVFCTERKDQNKLNDSSAAIAQCGLARTKDLNHWQRLPDLITHSGQQRNVVLHPEFIDSQYAFYTRPQDGFIDVGGGGGIGWGLCEDITQAEIKHERIIDEKIYHTNHETKNGQGPAPIKTAEGWIHLAHGVRNTAAGLRYVLYAFMTDLNEPWRISHKPGGYFLAPRGNERVGDVSNVCFCNGWIEKDGDIFIYYASSDTRIHVATTTVEKLLDYLKHTPEDMHFSHKSVESRIKLIDSNQNFM